MLIPGSGLGIPGLMPVGYFAEFAPMLFVTCMCTHKQSIKLLYKIIFAFSCNYECIFVLLKWKDLQ